jgi:hypothetical protein
MTERTRQVLSLVLASLAFATLVVASLAGAETAATADEDRFVDRTLGFSFSKPRFAPSGEPNVTTVAVTLSGPPEGTFAPNVNVVVQNLDVSLDAYQKQQRAELKAAGWEVIEQAPRQISGRVTLRTHARGTVQGLEIEFLAVALKRDPSQLFVLTCTATTEQFPLYQAEFERVASSFVLQP